LKLQYLEYDFQGYLEKSGNILYGATYDGEECCEDIEASEAEECITYILAYAGGEKTWDIIGDDATVLEASLYENDTGCTEADDDLALILDEKSYEDDSKEVWNWNGIEKYIESKNGGDSE